MEESKKLNEKMNNLVKGLMDYVKEEDLESVHIVAKESGASVAVVRKSDEN